METEHHIQNEQTQDAKNCHSTTNMDNSFYAVLVVVVVVVVLLCRPGRRYLDEKPALLNLTNDMVSYV